MRLGEDYDRFDLLEAIYIYCSLYHYGQGCPLYKRLCRVLALGFRPSAACASLDVGRQTETVQILIKKMEISQ